MPAQFPRLAGQHAEYVQAQMQAFRKGERANDPANTHATDRRKDERQRKSKRYRTTWLVCAKLAGQRHVLKKVAQATFFY